MILITPFKLAIKSVLTSKFIASEIGKELVTRNRYKLHLGSGSAIIPGYINVDLLPIPGIALRCDLSKTLPFKDESVHECYLCHVLEHFGTEQVPGILNELSRIMKPGAVLRVCVPDLDTIFRTYVENIEWFSPPHNPWLGLIYGGQKDAFDFHRTGFNFRWLRYLLEDAGFSDVERYFPEEICGIRDASFADEPFGVNVSLNVRATRV